MSTKKRIEDLTAYWKEKTIEELLRSIADDFGKRAALSTSFSLEDQILSHIILSNGLPIRIFTLDTGRHFEETYKVLEQTNKKYSTHIEVFTPQQNHLELLISE